LLLLLERASDIRKVLTHFRRLGFDNIYGFLCQGIGEWQEQGKPIDHLGTLSAPELYNRLSRFAVLDVREPSEWKQEGTIKGAEKVFFGYLRMKADNVERNKPIAVICSVGNRASVAASILKQKGFIEVYNVLGGMTAWTGLGYPVTKE
jgi:hydroxyacylglutathione hydrolase